MYGLEGLNEFDAGLDIGKDLVTMANSPMVCCRFGERVIIEELTIWPRLAPCVMLCVDRFLYKVKLLDNL